MSVFHFFSPKCTLFGYECINGLGEELALAGYRRALIVTDVSLVRLGIIKKITDILESSKIDWCLFDGVNPNPNCSDVSRGVAEVKKNGCDVLISVGGGSAHDCAKAVSILATNGGNVMDYKGVDKSKVPALPLVAINTTAGTASECTRAYVIVDEKNNEKFGNRDRNALPSIAVDDHSLMMELPKQLTAGTGMDALTHAVEAYTSVNGFLITSSLALASMRLIFRNLEAAVQMPDEKSREGMAVGQYLAGLAFGNAGCGLVHAMSHPLSAVYGLPHGLCNAILLPKIMRFHLCSEIITHQYSEIAAEIDPLECKDMNEKERAMYLIQKIERLSHIIGTDMALETLGVKNEDMGMLADKAMCDGSLKNNRVRPEKWQVEAIYQTCMEMEAYSD